MRGKIVDIPMAEKNCDAYVSFLSSQKPLPAVLLYMDAVGLRKRIFEMADHLAERGYFVVAPNTFYRSKRAPVLDYDHYLKKENIPALFQQVMALASELKQEMGKQDVSYFLKYLKSQPQVNPQKIATAGYCMGGGHALRAAGNYPDAFLATASFHAGNLYTNAENSPHRLFPNIQAEIYIGHADNDKHMPPEQIEKVSSLLKDRDKNFKAELYAGSAHGWTMKDLPAYNPNGEKKHWEELLALLKRTLH